MGGWGTVVPWTADGGIGEDGVSLAGRTSSPRSKGAVAEGAGSTGADVGSGTVSNALAGTSSPVVVEDAVAPSAANVDNGDVTKGAAFIHADGRGSNPRGGSGTPSVGDSASTLPGVVEAAAR